MITKLCRGCVFIKPHYDATYLCIDCHKAAQRRRYAANPQLQIARVKAYDLKTNRKH